MKFKAFWLLSSCILRKCYLICQIILLVLLNCFENLLKVLHIQNVQKKVVKYPVTNSPQQFFKGLLYKALNSAGLIFANFPPILKNNFHKAFFFRGGGICQILQYHHSEKSSNYNRTFQYAKNFPKFIYQWPLFPKNIFSPKNQFSQKFVGFRYIANVLVAVKDILPINICSILINCYLSYLSIISQPLSPWNTHIKTVTPMI